jgi:type IV pilus assembly protein PilC
MSTFAYKALDPTGSTVQGEIEADDKVAVASQLRSRGLIVVDIDEQSAGGGDIFERFKKVKANELTIMTRQFSTMVSSGMSMLRALYVLEEQQENKKLKDAVSQVRKDVEAGLALSDALARHPDIFNELYVAMVQAGETGESWRRRSTALPTSSRRTPRCGARSSRRWSTRR